MPKGYEDTYMPHCGSCAIWRPVKPATFGACKVQRVRRTRSVFTAKLGLMPYHAVCKEWKVREEK
jgi:hypothetical protein